LGEKVTSGIQGPPGSAGEGALSGRLRDAECRLDFVRHYLKELRSHPVDSPEHAAALELTLAAERRAIEECERLRNLAQQQ